MSWDDDYDYDDYDHDDDYGSDDYGNDDYGSNDYDSDEYMDDLEDEEDEDLLEELEECDLEELEDLDEEEVEELLNENHSIEEIEEELIDREEEVLHGIRIEQTEKRTDLVGRLFGLSHKVQVMHCPYCLTNKVHTERPGEWFCETCQDVFLEAISD